MEEPLAYSLKVFLKVLFSGIRGFALTSKIGLGSTQTLLATMKSKNILKAVVAICHDLNMVILNANVKIEDDNDK